MWLVCLFGFWELATFSADSCRGKALIRKQRKPDSRMKGMELIIGFSHCCCTTCLGFVGANNSVWNQAKSNSWHTWAVHTHISVLIRRRYQAMHSCCSCSSPTLPGYLQHQFHLRWRWRNKGLVWAQDVRGQLQMGCDSRGLQITGISSGVEIMEMRRNRKVCDTLTLAWEAAWIRSS